MENGITNGFSSGEYAGKFGVGLPCTREQAMTFMWRMAGKPEPKAGANPFKDIKPSDYYYKAVLWASQNGIANGYSSGEYAGKYGVGLEGDGVQNFVQTMETWNASVAEGEDKEFGRKGVDQDLSVAPFYAIKIAPGIHHTMGGIKINTMAQVISTEGEVIPGLFACGETTGGIHGGNRVGGNAVADFTIFGRIAGQNAAAFANGTLTAEEPAAEALAEEPAAAAEGAQTVTVTKPGVFGEDVVVEIVADAGEIYSVTVVKNNETMGIGSMAVDQLPAKIVEAQSADIDGVTGATMTSNAIKAAVAEALEQIGFGA